MSARDYTGVATRELAKIVKCELPTNEEFDVASWATLVGTTQEQVNRVLREEYRFTGLSVADRILLGLGYFISTTSLIVVPANSRSAAVRMATDEFEATHYRKALPDDLWEIEDRADALMWLREAVLGPMTPYQMQVKERDAQQALAKKLKREAQRAQHGKVMRSVAG